jgi:tripartite-type tricarboxylate transporter receptor subunit TctC
MKPGLVIGRRRLVGGAAAIALAPRAVASAFADTWPARPVRVIVPFAPGGSTDVVARLVGDRLTRLWGQAVVVENKPGAATNLAAETVAKSEPSGYTMLMGSPSLATSRNLYTSLNYALSDLAPVTLVCTFPIVMVTPPTAATKTVPDVIALARARPGKLSYASPGVGTTPHLAGELFKQMTGTDMTHVPYRGDAPALTDTMAGRVDLQFAGSGVLEAVRSGQVRGLAVTTAERVPAAPELPTVAESGVPGYAVATWFALFAPARTPRDIIAKVNKDAERVLGDPTVQARFQQIGMTAAGSTPEALGARLDAEVKKWGAVIKTANITLDQ